ncbi:MAG: hypothetical protein Q4Q17_04600 [Tissierellia bacterium]|nr:hypothetical protein [Tissierellia bacterium]
MDNKKHWITGGAVIFLVIGLFFAIKRLIINFAIFKAADWVSGGNSLIASLGSAHKFIIYLIAIIYIGVAIYGFLTKNPQSVGLLIIGGVAILFGIIGIFKNGGLFDWLKLAAGVCYALPPLLSRAKS